jgi:hypothetical protein
MSDQSQLYIKDIFTHLPDSTCCGQISQMMYYISPASNSNVDFCTIDFDKFEVCYYKKPLERLIHQEIARCDTYIGNYEDEIKQIQLSGIYKNRKAYFLNNLKSFHICYLNEEDFKKEQQKMTLKIRIYQNKIEKLSQKKKALMYGMDHYIFYLDQLYQMLKSNLGNSFSYMKETIPYNDIHSNAIINDIISYYKIVELKEKYDDSQFIFL